MTALSSERDTKFVLEVTYAVSPRLKESLLASSTKSSCSKAVKASTERMESCIASMRFSISRFCVLSCSAFV